MSRKAGRNAKGKQPNRPRRNKGSNKRTTNLKVSVPSGMSNVITNKGALKTMRIRHREFVKDLTTNGTANQLSIMRVNPGNTTMFPWLSSIANRFESYVFNGLRFNYVPSVGTTSTGAIALAPDYDAADDNSGISKPKLLTFDDSVRGPLWKGFSCICKKNNLQKSKSYYVLDGLAPAGTDIKMYDALQLIISTTTSSNMTIGELWVEYDITLLTPQMTKDESFRARWKYRSNHLLTAFSKSQLYNNIGVEFSQTGDGATFDFPPGWGQYLITATSDYFSPGAVNDEINFQSATVKTGPGFLDGGLLNNIYSVAGANSESYTRHYVFETPDHEYENESDARYRLAWKNTTVGGSGSYHDAVVSIERLDPFSAILMAPIVFNINCEPDRIEKVKKGGDSERKKSIDCDVNRLERSDEPSYDECFMKEALKLAKRLQSGENQ